MRDPADAHAASQFYTGLVADLYEPLLSEPPRADAYTAFLDRAGAPALELACGSGLPLVELVERGYDVDGLDSSQDMLDRCHARAADRGVKVTVYRAEMESFALPRRYRAIFLAGASFTLLTSDEDAARALACMHAHLEPGGSVLIPLETHDLETSRKLIGVTKEVATPEGDRLRITMDGIDPSADGRTVRRHLRYERLRSTGEHEVVERTWERRSWSQERFREMLVAAGFDKVSFVAPSGGRAAPDRPVFVALARREQSHQP